MERFSPQFTEQLHQAASIVSFGLGSNGKEEEKIIALEQSLQHREKEAL